MHFASTLLLLEQLCRKQPFHSLISKPVCIRIPPFLLLFFSRFYNHSSTLQLLSFVHVHYYHHFNEISLRCKRRDAGFVVGWLTKASKPLVSARLWRTVRGGAAGAHKELIQVSSNPFNRQVIREVQPKAHRRRCVAEICCLSISGTTHYCHVPRNLAGHAQWALNRAPPQGQVNQTGLTEFSRREGFYTNPIVFFFFVQ